MLYKTTTTDLQITHESYTVLMTERNTKGTALK